MKKSFSLHRTGWLLKWLVGNNMRRLFTLAGIMMGVLAFMTVLNLLGNRQMFGYHLVVMQAAGMASAMIMLLLILSPAFIMRKLNHTEKAVEFFALPAALSEKYVAAWIFVVFGGLLAFVAGLILYDAVQFLVATVFLPGQAELASAYLLERMFFDGSNFSLSLDGMSMTSGKALAEWTFLFWLQSLYALGGTFFRRFQWLIVSVFLFALMMSLAFWLSRQFSFQDVVAFRDFRVDYFMVCAVFALLTILNYWLSFHFFKRFQVINNKWVNA